MRARFTITSHERGHPTVWDDERQLWCYADNGEPCEMWGGQPRPCYGCGEFPTPEGYDPCIGYVEGLTSVCCGHGVHEPYSR